MIPFRIRLLIQPRPVGNIYGDYTDILFFGSEIVLTFLLICWLAYKTFIKERFVKGSVLILAPMIGLSMISGVSILTSVDPLLSLSHLGHLALLMGLAFYVVDQMQGIEQIIVPVMIQVAIQSVVGIGQFLRQGHIGLQLIGEHRLDPAWQGISIVLVDGQRWLRAYGLSDHPNILGGCLVFGLLILIGDYLQSKKRRTLIILVIGLGVITLFLTFSRSGWLALVAGFFVIAAYGISSTASNKMAKRGISLTIVVGLMVLPFVIGYSDLLMTRLPIGRGESVEPTEIQAIGERVLLNESSIRVFEAHPLTGVGIGTLPQAIRLRFPDFSTYYQPAHVALIVVAAESGIIGATLYFVLMVVPILILMLDKDLRSSFFLMIITSTLLAVVVVGLFDYYTWSLTAGRLWQYLLWGVWMVEYRKMRGAIRVS